MDIIPRLPGTISGYSEFRATEFLARQAEKLVCSNPVQLKHYRRCCKSVNGSLGAFSRFLIVWHKYISCLSEFFLMLYLRKITFFFINEKEMFSSVFDKMKKFQTATLISIRGVDAMTYSISIRVLQGNVLLRTPLERFRKHTNTILRRTRLLQRSPWERGWSEVHTEQVERGRTDQPSIPLSATLLNQTVSPFMNFYSYHSHFSIWLQPLQDSQNYSPDY